MNCSPDAVAAIIARVGEININSEQYSMDFGLQLSVDSLTQIEILSAVEREFSLNIPDDDVPKLRSVDTIVAYLGSNGHPGANE